MRKLLLTSASIGAMAALLPAWAAAQDYIAQSTVSVDGDVVDNGPVSDADSERLNEIDNSYDYTDGLHQAQQNNGSLNAMQIGTDVMVNVDATDDDPDVLSDVTVSGGLDNNGTVSQGPAYSYDPDRENRIDDQSFDEADGLFSVQQNNGDTNVMGIGTSVVAMTENDEIGTVTQNVDVTGPDPDNPADPWLDADGDGDLWALDLGDVQRDNVIEDSFNGFDGVANVQQNNGSQNLMGIGTSVVGAEGADIEEVEQTVSSAGGYDDDPFDQNDHVGQIDGIATTDWGSDRSNRIADSFRDGEGWLNVQQNNGNVNAMSMANGLLGQAEDLAADSEADAVTQTVSSGGSVTDVYADNAPFGHIDPARDNAIVEGTAEDSGGVFNVQQNNGDLNSISQSTAVVASVGDADRIGDLTQDVDTNGSVSNFTDVNESISDWNSQRDNVISGDSFDGFEGLSQVQQNNGDANVLGASMAVSAMVDDSAGQTTEESFGDTVQDVSTYGLVQDVENVVDVQDGERPGERSNIVEDAYEDGFDGAAVAQQNNGSANVIGSGVAIQVADMTDIDGNLEELDQDVTTEGVVNFQNQGGNNAWFEGSLSDRDNLVSDSFEESDGLAAIQQNNGDGNVLGSSIAVFAATGAEDIDGPSTMDTTTIGEVTNNDLRGGLVSPPAGDFGADRDNQILDDSFEDFGGVASVQQNNGNANVLGTSIAINASLDPGQGPVDGALTVNTSAEGTVDNNEVYESPQATRDNEIDSSFDNDFSGVASTTQNNGDANVLNTSTSVAVHEENGGPGFGPVVSETTLAGTVSNNQVTTVGHSSGPSHSNTISGSFDSASGVSSTIQNNGSANVVQSSISVTVNGNLDDL